MPRWPRLKKRRQKNLFRVFEVQQCNEGADCLNSISKVGFGNQKCGICRFAPNNDSPMAVSYWKPVDGKTKHPAATAILRAKKQARVLELRQEKRSRDQAKRRISVLAARAEKQTESNIIRATKNSGRSRKDGDHLAAGQITIDTKLQSRRESPVVLLSELAKVREDAGRAGNWLGCLVLRNKNGVGVVALAEEDFARLIALLGQI
jgi:hypothetical protein